MKKIIIIALGLYAIGFGAYYYYHVVQTSAQDTAALPAAQTTPRFKTPPPFVPRHLDVDAMAARMKDHQDVYKRLRDASLKAYAAGAQPGKDDALNAELIRMSAYLWVWHDFYCEGLWREYENSAEIEIGDGSINASPLVYTYRTMEFMRAHYCSNDALMTPIRELAEKMDKSDYPMEFKLASWRNVADVLCKSSEYPEAKDAMAKSYATLPDVVKKTAACYQALIKEGLPDDVLYDQADACLDAVKDNEEAFVEMGTELDKAFAAEAPDSPARTSLQGEYYIDYAWMARGSGWSDTVTEEGNRLMQVRLAKAADILEAAYAKYPQFVPISRCMLKVELGQGEGTARMETWFQRAIQADPDDCGTYRAKAYYLLPRWYGSTELSWQFGLDCAKTQNWRAGIPLMLVYAAGDFTVTKNTAEFEDPAIWTPLEKVFRDWLERYPESTICRSEFVKYAALGNHWAVVKEQCAILGDYWDRDTFKGINYEAFKKLADEQTRMK